MKDIVIILVKRLRSASPELFKKIRNYAFWFGMVASLLLMLPLGLPAWLISLLTLLTGMASGITGTAQLTTSDKSIQEETEKHINHGLFTFKQQQWQK